MMVSFLPVEGEAVLAPPAAVASGQGLGRAWQVLTQVPGHFDL